MKKIRSLMWIISGMLLFLPSYAAAQEEKSTDLLLDKIELYGTSQRYDMTEGVMFDRSVTGLFCIHAKKETVFSGRFGVKPLDSVALREVEGKLSRDGLFILSEEEYSLDEGEDLPLSFVFAREGRWQFVFCCQEGEKEYRITSREFLLDRSTPECSVFYYEESRKEKPASIENRNRCIAEIEREAVSPLSEVFIRKDTPIVILIRDPYFQEKNMQLTVFGQSDYQTDMRDVTSDIVKQEWKNCGQDLYRMELFVDKEGHYQIEVCYRDVYGHPMIAAAGIPEKSCYKSGRYLGPLCTLDITSPVMKQPEYLMTPEKKRDDTTYFFQFPDIRITIEEENFNKDNFSFSSNQKLPKELIWESGYKDGKRWNTTVIRGGAERQYFLRFQVYDSSGLKGNDQTARFCVDCHGPKVRLSFEGLTEPWNYDYGNGVWMSNNPISFRITAKDLGCGMDQVSCSFLDQDNNCVKKIVKRAEDQQKDMVFEIVPTWKDFRGSIRIEARDYLGIAQQEIVEKEVLWESKQRHKEESSIQYELPGAVYTDEKAGIKYYRNSLELTVKEQDLCSGIKQSEFAVIFGDKKKIVSEENYSKRHITYEVSQTIRMPKEEYMNSCRQHPIYLSTLFEDNVGYITKKDNEQYALVIDHTPPKITVKYDNEKQNSCYAKARTAEVIVTDWNFSPELVQWDITGSKAGYHIGSWQEDGNRYRCRVSFEGEGEDYKLALSVKDYAGNTSIWDDDTPFSIDRTAPEVSLESDTKGTQSFFNKTKTLSFKVRDKNVDAKSGDIIVYRDGKKIEIPLKNREYSSAESKYSYFFDRDGTYRVFFSCRDNAGNQSKIIKSEEFTIDRTKPLIQVNYLQNNKTYTERIAPQIIISDLHLKKDSITVDLQSINQKTIKNNKMLPEIIEENGMIRLQWKDFPRKESMDQAYCLRVTALDQAGNKQSLGKGILFYVNRFGMKFSMPEETKKLIQTKYITKERAVEMKGYSVNPVESSVIIRKNNEEWRTLYVPDYREDIKSNSKKGGYNITYTIDKGVFSEEGSYQILIKAKAYELRNNEKNYLNESENSLWMPPLAFVVDKTPPAIEIGGLEEKVYAVDKQPFTVTAIDNQKIKSVRILVMRGKEKKASEEYIFKESDFNSLHSLSLYLKEYDGYQHIYYEAEDYAGNKVSSVDLGDHHEALVTKNRFLTEYYLHPIVSMVIILSIGIMIFVVLIEFVCMILTGHLIFGIFDRKEKRLNRTREQ